MGSHIQALFNSTKSHIMTNEEKAQELGIKHARQYHHNSYPDYSDNNEYVFSNKEIENACVEMAEWKDEKFTKERRETLQQAYDSANKTNEAVAELVRERIRTDIEQWLTEHGLEWELKDILDLI